MVDFGDLSSEDAFLKLAVTFEDTGVSAYNGAAPSIKSKEVLAAAGSIVQVEAATRRRPAAGQEPGPDAFDKTLTGQVLKAVSRSSSLTSVVVRRAALPGAAATTVKLLRWRRSAAVAIEEFKFVPATWRSTRARAWWDNRDTPRTRRPRRTTRARRSTPRWSRRRSRARDLRRPALRLHLRPPSVHEGHVVVR